MEDLEELSQEEKDFIEYLQNMTDKDLKKIMNDVEKEYFNF